MTHLAKYALSALLLCLLMPDRANACTAIVAGKKASATGHVLVGHNEDGSKAFMRYAMLPRRDGKAAAFWSDVKHFDGNDKVAGSFYNEHGVFVTSNNGGVMREWGQEKYELPDEGQFSSLEGDGIGYNLRVEMIRRAKTAREGVDIMIDLIEKHGYSMDSRNFLIADSEEAWILEALYGRRYIARRVPDDEVVVYPNCLVFNKPRPGDIVCKCFKEKGKDLDIIAAYQGPRTWKSVYNLYRWREMYRIVCGVTVDANGDYPFSVKPSHAITADDIKRGLRSHYEGSDHEVKPRHPEKGPGIVAPICRNSTLESLVCELAPNAKNAVVHLTVGRPCEKSYGVYRPFDGQLPDGTVSGEEALARLKNYNLPATPSEPVSSDTAQVNQEIEAYAKEYMHFLSVAKTERRAYAEAVRRLDAAGFKDLATVKSLKPGDKVYRGYHGKTLMACVIGSAPCAEGLRVVGGHIDSPRLDLKPRPLYTRGGIVYFDTRMYGGIKKYQWLVHPLALYGVIVRKDGTKAEVAMGDRPGDPVFMISDILPHFGRDQENKSQRDFYPAEDLDVIAGTLPLAEANGGKTPAAKQALVEFLKKEYNVTEEDLLSAELEIVPAGMPREVGLDRSLIAAYGQDDSACAYAGLSALLDVSARKTPPAKTCALILCDKEEIGSTGASGMDSTFFENTVAELLNRQNAQARDIDVRRALERSTMLSADVTAASDPHFPDADSTGNAARLNKGPVAAKYTGGASKGGASDCRAEFVAEIRRIMDGAGVTWQMAELGKAEKGGGGTISKFMARYGMDVLDFGTPLLNMHAPWELSAKADCFWTQRAYRAYFAD